MQNNVLIIGGKGLVGGTIARILKERNPQCNIILGTRAPKDLQKEVQIDVNSPSSLEVILSRSINLIILSVNDQKDYVLRFAIEHGIDYLDITKPTPALHKALQITTEYTKYNSRIVFGSGWMGGIVPGLVKSAVPATEKIESVQLMVYYSIKDKAGESSAHFMAEHVATPFVQYQKNQPKEVLHFLDSESYCFSFGLRNRQVYNFDTPDLYILNQVEAVPTVSVKMTYNSKFLTRVLGWMQQFGVFKRMSLKARRKTFGGSGAGDISVFEIIIKGSQQVRRILLKSDRGQAELTALSAVLHTEVLFSNEVLPGQYFAHQLHGEKALFTDLQQYDSITIKEI
ncbi:saccharopine dehydrogenase NADP-binding domain-containing protein [Myroides odoratimimus]|uniref:saccharopine dehydrogenase NADP-binding domain-containing protein n=1 Tax=Myroides odoratimimus TaxID=76832 RepID=UPI002DB78BE5|nr:saccharopine dehydrogenase NADP-binding domain-containing protein [Myroides odoratimimus]MEC4092408.1 saccharopine dehydrogenase NADP-binding domain-containing protein [Myroides odoratimimus]